MYVNTISELKKKHQQNVIMITTVKESTVSSSTSSTLMTMIIMMVLLLGLSSSVVNAASNSTSSIECSKDSDCPTIFCIMAPCPMNVCRSNKCVIKQPSPVTTPATKPVASSSAAAECSKNADCPPINCLVAPCPTNVCRNNKCVVKLPSPGPAPATKPKAPTKPECWKDSDCPTIYCIKAPCPTNVCRNNKCKIKQPSPTAPRKPVTRAPRKPFTYKPRTSKPRAPTTPVVRPPVVKSDNSTSIKCGNTTCTNGKYCCNASCGICAKPGGSCIELFCLDNATSIETNGKCTSDDDCTDDGKICNLSKGTCITPPPAKCGNTTCPSGKYCCNASCGICAKPGVMCTMQACDATPVDKNGKCTSDDDCTDDGKICNLSKGTCITPPPAKCGNTTCPSGKYCCNASCGICAKPGVMCTMQVCDATPVGNNGKCTSDDDCTDDGKVCNLSKGICIAPPPVKCGNTTCPSGNYCCNSSCGICAKPGFMCIMKAC